MKKLLILALALVMALTVSFGVFAEEIIGGNSGAANLSDPANIDVDVSVNTPTVSTVYRVDIAWDNVAFTYTPAYDNDWDPLDLLR